MQRCLAGLAKTCPNSHQAGQNPGFPVRQRKMSLKVIDDVEEWQGRGGRKRGISR